MLPDSYTITCPQVSLPLAEALQDGAMQSTFLPRQLLDDREVVEAGQAERNARLPGSPHGVGEGRRLPA